LSPASSLAASNRAPLSTADGALTCAAEIPQGAGVCIVGGTSQDLLAAAERGALGAGRARVAAQLLTEGLVVSAIGAVAGVAIAIVAEGTLAILGVGVKPPTPSWGNIIAVDRGELFTSPHITFEPSILIFVTVLALNFLGDVVRSRFDVREAGI